MPDTALAQLLRLLSVIPLFADGEEHPVDAVAGRVGTDRDTLVADLKLLMERDLDPPGWVERIGCTIDDEQVSVNTRYFLRPLRVTLPQVAALELGLALLERERPREERAGIARVREALAQVRVRLEPEVLESGALGAAVDPAILATVRRAAHERHKVRLTYQGSGDAAPVARTACPYGLVFAERMWYLVAHCERGEGLRFFRVDRIHAAEPLAATFAEPADFSLEDQVRDGRLFSGEAASRLRVRFSPAVARWIAEREGRQPEADGSLTVEYPLADPEWAIRHVLQYGPEARVLEPAWLVERVRERLRAMQA
ncbi:MAG: WYL domain-containing protein [Gemmatimonadetes bacterium]|nr:WYL domain-containing protein [Gemmatimonadota bacterium]